MAEACGGELIAGSSSIWVTRVSTDSRKTQPGDLFVALAGERFDGHEYVRQVAEKGAAAVLVDRAKVSAPLPDCAVIAVDNTRQALGRLGARYRSDFDLPIVAVGGSNGKTTTKELLASVLRRRFKALWSEASFNNDIGVPVTLLDLDRSHRVAVLEIGTNHPGELAPLVRMIQPRYGVVASLGREHLEFFEDLNGVAEEEGWLAELLPADGRLFVNGDSPEMEQVVGRARAPVTRVGFGRHNDWRASDARLDEAGVAFEVAADNAAHSGSYRVNLVGRHQVTNALLAAATAAELGVAPEEIQRGLAECRPARMRMQIWKTNGVSVLDDSYNANADSVAAALQTLMDFPCGGRRVAVLGDMAELGRHAADAHAEVGRRAAEGHVDQLFAVGKMAGVMGAAARAAGLMQVSELGEVETAANVVKRFVRSGDVVLVKASRASRLERIGEVLRDND
ncbi:MAG TPA: UDP-N-acetylmuramoyl-tripeptide--D-alanyl-D-alanine ligase [Verrucomicrobiae bacterium]|nr:UDP-N-acetylmuramoyl-tripeptide--D-alanyl-D-alanine ligase [Verrucomicrobiae bacterium]